MAEAPAAKRTRVVVTRSSEDAPIMAALVRELGMEPVELPAISFQDPEDWAPVDEALAALDFFQWLVFTSARAVERFRGRAAQHREGLAGLHRLSIAAVGPPTARALAVGGLPAHLVPAEYTSRGLLEELAPRVAGARLLLPRGDLAEPGLPHGLEAAGAQVVEVVVYRTVPPPGLRDAALRLLREGIDVICFTSTSTVENLATALGPDVSLLQAVPVAVIGPVTARAAREAGLTIAVEARESTVPGLVTALQRWRAAREERDGH